MKQSIRNRLLGTTALVLVVFLTLTGWVLDSAYRASVTTGAEEQLKLVIFSVMGAVGEEEGQLIVGDELSTPRLAQPDSGLYAQLRDDILGPLWTSSSMVTTDVPFLEEPGEPGAFLFRSVGGHFILSYTVIWEGADNERITFQAATDRAPFQASINRFRGSLGVGFALAMVFFVIAQILALRWGLRPLHVMASEVHELEMGERDKLGDEYPQELQGLAGNLDRFVAHEQRSRSRYRHALEDLAHSLKTPLAVVRNALLDAAPDKSLMGEQFDRMETTVAHQLSKASTRGPVVVGQRVDVAHQLQRLLRALEIAYADKGVQVTSDLTAASVHGDESDYLEIFGNLLENAFKYTKNRVHVATGLADDKVFIAVEDDGRGIPQAMRQEVLNRGKRLDEIAPGQGIGLAMVADLVDLYAGTLSIEESQFGGARLRVEFTPID